jgi:hypothetical protein
MVEDLLREKSKKELIEQTMARKLQRRQTELKVNFCPI